MRRKQAPSPVNLADLRARAEVVERYALRRDATHPAWCMIALVRLASSTARMLRAHFDQSGHATPQVLGELLEHFTAKRLAPVGLAELGPAVRYYTGAIRDPIAFGLELKRAREARAQIGALLPLLPPLVYDDKEGVPVHTERFLDYQLECVRDGVTPLIDAQFLLDLGASLPKGPTEAPGRDRPRYTAQELIEHRELAEALAHCFELYCLQTGSSKLLDRHERGAIRECRARRGTPDGSIGVLRWSIPRHVHADRLDQPTRMHTRYRPNPQP